MAHGSGDITADVTANIKWYNPNKGFGFAQPEGGGGDAFLHASVVTQSGYQNPQEGDVIICDIAAGPRGLQVVAIHHVEPSKREQGQGGEVSGEVIEGVVKFFDASKGFGFVLPDGGGQDIFISARILTRSGVETLEADQRVRVTTRIGQKGPTAEDVTLI